MSQTKSLLIIDAQVFQTASWHRGMGKYSMALLEGMAQQEETKDHEIKFLFNTSIDIPGEIEDNIAKIFPDAELIKLDLAMPREPRTDHSIKPTISANKKTLGNYIKNAHGDKNVSVLILALYLDEVVPVFPDASVNTNNMLIYYDSIPLLYHQRYGQFKGFFENFYLPHTATVYEADKILTISKTVANDLHIMLGIQKERITNIDGASIPRRAMKGVAPKNFSHKNFILMVSGQELRKNNHRAIQGFEQFRVTSDQQDLMLVVTSTFSPEARKELSELSPNVIFTGNVSEEELSWIYKKSRFIFFASEYEGLGLPVLEAVEESKVVACSNIPVFKEMSENGFSFFDPLNVDEIAVGLATANQRSLKGEIDKNEYKRIIKKYSWPRSAKELLATIEVKKPVDPSVTKPRVAIFCPDPSGFSAIGKVVAESHADYAEYFDIDYYYDRGPNHRYMRPDVLSHLVNTYDAEDFTPNRYDKYDAVIYHIGNSEYHLNIIRTALALPGYVIFHDTNLEGAYNSLLEQGYISQKRYLLEKRLDKLSGSGEVASHSQFLASIAAGQKGIIVHSDYAKSAIKNKLINKVPISKVNLPVSTPIYPDILKNNNSHLNISLAGIIAKVKGTDIIRSIALDDQFANCSINIFGYSAVEPEILEEMRSLPHVNIKTNPTDFEFQQLMSSTDILINVRLVYRGETSLTTLEQMRFGGVVLVRDFGWYSELPSDSVIKVSDPDDVLEQLEKLVGNRERLDAISHNSLSYIAENHSHLMYAQGMRDLIAQSSK